MELEKNQPTKGSWDSDWKAAEAKAQAFEEKTNGKQWKSANEGSGKDGAEEPQAGGGQEELQGAADDQSGQVEQPERPSEGQGSGDDDEHQRQASQQGGPESLERAERIARIKADAEALGWQVEANAVTVADRAKFREEKRNFRNKLAAEADEAKRYLQDMAERHKEDIERARGLKEAIENNDLDGVARAVGRGSWNELSDEAFKRQLSPEHKELIQLRRQNAENERKRKEHEARAESEARAREAHQQRQKYRVELSKEIAGLRDKTLAAFADDPSFVQSVMDYQEEEWDGHETISVGEAAKKAFADARALYDKLSKRIGARATKQPEDDSEPTGEANNAEQQRRKSPKTVPQKEVTDASANANQDQLDERAWSNKWAAQLKNSHPDS